jgi:hypothetical protein
MFFLVILMQRIALPEGQSEGLCGLNAPFFLSISAISWPDSPQDGLDNVADWPGS